MVAEQSMMNERRTYRAPLWWPYWPSLRTYCCTPQPAFSAAFSHTGAGRRKILISRVGCNIEGRADTAAAAGPVQSRQKERKGRARARGVYFSRYNTIVVSCPLSFSSGGLVRASHRRRQKINKPT